MGRENATDFDVMRVMSQRNLDIRLATDLLRIQKVKAGTQVTVGIPGDVVGGIANGELLCGFYLMDKRQFLAIKNELTDGESKR